MEFLENWLGEMEEDWKIWIKSRGRGSDHGFVFNWRERKRKEKRKDRQIDFLFLVSCLTKFKSVTEDRYIFNRVA